MGLDGPGSDPVGELQKLARAGEGDATALGVARQRPSQADILQHAASSPARTSTFLTGLLEDATDNHALVAPSTGGSPARGRDHHSGHPADPR